MVEGSSPPVERRSLADMVGSLEAVERARAAGQLTEAEYAERSRELGHQIEARRAALPLYEREGVTYRAHRIHGPDDGPAMADYLVRRDSDQRYGGYVVDLAQDGDEKVFGPEDVRFEGYDDRGQYLAAACSMRGILSVFAQPDRGIRWISDRLPEIEAEPGI